MNATFSVDVVDPVRMESVRSQMAWCESLRPKAVYNTGSITEAAVVYLRSLCEMYEPRTIVEVGTFIGTSTTAMAACRTVQAVYTCDKDNDCLPSEGKIHCFPKQTSTQMLATLTGHHGMSAIDPVDFFFFDGRIQAQDLALILRLSKPSTIYVFDDFEHEEKGVLNVRLLAPYLKHCALVPPPVNVAGLQTRTTIACLVPKDML